MSSIGSVIGQSISPQDRLIGDFEKSGLSSDTASRVAGEIEDTLQSLKSAGARSGSISVRDAMEKQLSQDVSSGALSSEDADLVRKTLDEFDRRMEAGQRQGNRPDPAQLFSQLDSDGDGSLTRDEFVSNRPKEVSEEQAGQMYDSIAGGNTGGLSQEQFISGMSALSPQGGAGGPPPAGGGAEGGAAAGSSKTETGRSSTTQGTTTTTVITYSDGTKETKVTYGASASTDKSSVQTLQDLLKEAAQDGDTSNAASYLGSMLRKGLVDISA